MALLDPRSRVLRVLMQHVGRQLTHQQIASIVGAARESVSRVLSDFRRQGQLPAALGRPGAAGRSGPASGECPREG